MIDLTQYRRRATHEVRIGACTIGGTHPVAVQSTNTDTRDTAACVAQIERIARAGAPIARLTGGAREAENRATSPSGCVPTSGIRRPSWPTSISLPEAAAVAAQYVDKVRINPATTASTAAANWKRSSPAAAERASRCASASTTARSRSAHLRRVGGDTPEGMVAAAMEFLHV